VFAPWKEFRMRRFATLAALLLVSNAAHAAIAPGPYYARGDFYVAPGSPGSAADGTWGYTPAQQLFDDGLHGDGAAGDGVYGVDVPCVSPGYHEFKIANADWTFNQPFVAEAALVNGRLFPDVAGQVVHFSLDVNAAGGGWLPDVAVANDHGYPSWATLEVIGSAPELGMWGSGLPADHVGGVWTKTVVIESPGAYEYKFRVQGTWGWANFGLHYNNNFGYNGTFDVTEPNQPVTIQFDERSGRIRAFVDPSTPTRSRTWGAIKAGYR
jgi:hypothetical protein